ncbi:hypothetical protein [Nocardiopsis composta]|uniref:Uncharacterized protein n=1 Tax=Nocardiopsis composta TaxID=157465 RepID=A0A7W8QNX1_9ACTN|nr:hypothetical protein [Nocardiopsis composta]MBB5433744.1 hypothetical protein [Nocardiopsis composta]
MSVIDRHPYPELRDAYSGRGWTFFRTDREPGEAPIVHAVFARTLPCAEALGVEEHIAAPLAELRAELARQAAAIEKHAETCRPCAHVVEMARRSATGTLLP